MKPNQFITQLDMFKPVQVGFNMVPEKREPSSITYIIEPTRIEQYCLDVLDGCGEYDPFQLCLQYNDEHNTRLDWHEFSNALDHLHTRHFVNVAGHTNDGMTIYSK